MKVKVVLCAGKTAKSLISKPLLHQSTYSLFCPPPPDSPTFSFFQLSFWNLINYFHLTWKPSIHISLSNYFIFKYWISTFDLVLHIFFGIMHKNPIWKTDSVLNICVCSNSQSTFIFLVSLTSTFVLLVSLIPNVRIFNQFNI